VPLSAGVSVAFWPLPNEDMKTSTKRSWRVNAT
jgi:hypothetical protein